MLKLLITGALIYFIYRFFIAPPALDRRDDPSIRQEGKQPDAEPGHDDEYIDYEEVE